MRGLLTAMALLTALPAWSSGLTLLPAPALGCLTPNAAARGSPEYPAERWKLGTAGRVLVELVFTGPDLRPEVKVLDSQGGEEFVDAVHAHVRGLRVPCLEAADIPARLRLDFVFKPTERSGAAPEIMDADAAERSQQFKCVLNTVNDQPAYPRQALESGLQGRLVVQLRFTSADSAPEVTVVARPASEVFLRPARRWAQGFRMPCFSGRPLRAEYLLIYRLSGANAFGFRELSLRQFVANIRGIEHQRVQFDFTTMGCPFEVRLNYRQPLLRNEAQQVSEPNPLRQPFLDWLESATLRLEEGSLDAVFGDSVVLHIPCTKINLQPPSTPTPKEKS